MVARGSEWWRGGQKGKDNWQLVSLGMMKSPQLDSRVHSLSQNLTSTQSTGLTVKCSLGCCSPLFGNHQTKLGLEFSGAGFGP